MARKSHSSQSSLRLLVRGRFKLLAGMSMLTTRRAPRNGDPSATFEGQAKRTGSPDPIRVSPAQMARPRKQ